MPRSASEDAPSEFDDGERAYEYYNNYDSSLSGVEEEVSGVMEDMVKLLETEQSAGAQSTAPPAVEDIAVVSDLNVSSSNEESSIEEHDAFLRNLRTSIANVIEKAESAKAANDFVDTAVRDAVNNASNRQVRFYEDPYIPFDAERQVQSKTPPKRRSTRSRDFSTPMRHGPGHTPPAAHQPTAPRLPRSHSPLRNRAAAMARMRSPTVLQRVQEIKEVQKQRAEGRRRTGSVRGL